MNDAERNQRDVLAELERIQGPEDPVALQSRSNLAKVLREQGRLEDSYAEYAIVQERRVRVLGRTHPATLGVCACLAVVLAELGDFAGAGAMCDFLDNAYADRSRQPDRETVETRSELAAVLHNAGRIREAKREYNWVLRVQEKIKGHSHPDTLVTRQALESISKAMREQRTRGTGRRNWPAEITPYA